MPSSRRRVVVTGLGTVNGLGSSVSEFWQRLIQGDSAAGAVTSFDASGWRTHLACEVREPLPETGRADRILELALTAAREALRQAGHLSPERTGVALGTLQGGTRTLERDLADQVRANQSPNLAASAAVYLPANLGRTVAETFALEGPVLTSVIACAASAGAIGRALDLIRLGQADAMLAGGSDAFCQLTFAGFNCMRSAAPTQCRPFSANREGLIIGEGAGVLVLEAEETALARGARPLAVVLGAGLAEDAYHITSPEPEGRGAVQAIRAALADAGLASAEIDYVNAHGTGTPANDSMETRALKAVFGERAPRVPVSSIKAAIGHCMGAAGAVEAVASVLTLQHQILPPTLNYTSGDLVCDLDYVPNQARNAMVEHVLSNSFGFAGNNACLVFGCCPEGTAL